LQTPAPFYANVVKSPCIKPSLIHVRCLLSLRDERSLVEGEPTTFFKPLHHYCCPCCSRKYDYHGLIEYVRASIESPMNIPDTKVSMNIPDTKVSMNIPDTKVSMNIRNEVEEDLRARIVYDLSRNDAYNLLLWELKCKPEKMGILIDHFKHYHERLKKHVHLYGEIQARVKIDLARLGELPSTRQKMALKRPHSKACSYSRKSPDQTVSLATKDCPYNIHLITLKFICDAAYHFDALLDAVEDLIHAEKMESENCTGINLNYSRFYRPFMMLNSREEVLELVGELLDSRNLVLRNGIHVFERYKYCGAIDSQLIGVFLVNNIVKYVGDDPLVALKGLSYFQLWQKTFFHSSFWNYFLFLVDRLMGLDPLVESKATNNDKNLSVPMNNDKSLSVPMSDVPVPMSDVPVPTSDAPVSDESFRQDIFVKLINVIILSETHAEGNYYKMLKNILAHFTNKKLAEDSLNAPFQFLIDMIAPVDADHWIRHRPRVIKQRDEAIADYFNAFVTVINECIMGRYNPRKINYPDKDCILRLVQELQKSYAIARRINHKLYLIPFFNEHYVRPNKPIRCKMQLCKELLSMNCGFAISTILNIMGSITEYEMNVVLGYLDSINDDNKIAAEVIVIFIEKFTAAIKHDISPYFDRMLMSCLEDGMMGDAESSAVAPTDNALVQNETAVVCEPAISHTSSNRIGSNQVCIFEAGAAEASSIAPSATSSNSRIASSATSSNSRITSSATSSNSRIASSPGNSGTTEPFHLFLFILERCLYRLTCTYKESSTCNEFILKVYIPLITKLRTVLEVLPLRTKFRQKFISHPKIMLMAEVLNPMILNSPIFSTIKESLLFEHMKITDAVIKNECITKFDTIWKRGCGIYHGTLSRTKRTGNTWGMVLKRFYESFVKKELLLANDSYLIEERLLKLLLSSAEHSQEILEYFFSHGTREYAIGSGILNQNKSGNQNPQGNAHEG